MKWSRVVQQEEWRGLIIGWGILEKKAFVNIYPDKTYTWIICISMLDIAIIAMLLLSTFHCRRFWPMDDTRNIWMKCDLCKAVKSNNRFPFSLHNGYQWRYEQRYGCFTQGHSTIIFNKKPFPLHLPSLLVFPRVCLFNVPQYNIF